MSVCLYTDTTQLLSTTGRHIYFIFHTVQGAEGGPK